MHFIKEETKTESTYLYAFPHSIKQQENKNIYGTRRQNKIRSLHYLNLDSR